jgi:hypothetical protein
MDIWNELEGELENYQSSTLLIRQYLSAYEGECEDLIRKISECSSFEKAQSYFDELHAVQRKLSIVRHKFEFPLSDKLTDFTYHLDRDDVYSRKYWCERFCKGLKWPDG